MRIDAVKLSTNNRLAIDYYQSDKAIMKYFDYLPFESATFQQRLADLKERQFNRFSLSEVLKQLNTDWDAPDSTLENIERLKDDNSVVVIGGQQAGLLTGPLFTIHKIVSIIHLAKKQEENLQVPVIPVFWIAGEDHDFEEINHILLAKKDRMQKYKIKQQVTNKQAMSSLELDKDAASHWIKQIFMDIPETEYTKDLYGLINKELDKSSSYVDFFARIILNLFEKEGLVLVDSGSPLVRELERNHFCELIDKQPWISKGVYQQTQKMKSNGYSVSIDAEENDAHVFYHKDGERILLIRDEEGNWVGKQNECRLTTDELLHIAKHKPELLSNNVVTRPLMQELLFPSLAFLGGLGEVAYWSVLKPAFEAIEIKMPPVLPRLSFTLMDRKIEKKLQHFGLDPIQVINRGLDQDKGNWLASQTSPPIELLTEQVKDSFDRAHKPLRNLANSLGPDLGGLAEKNLIYIFEDLHFLQDKMKKSLENKNKHAIESFNHMQTMLRPEGGLQERSWNVIPFINSFGTDFINQMVEHTYDFEQSHYIIYF
ncbi:bacillithiol biosynthesis cysteine-adding enzyme BshC [Aquibacillus albus]|uniref:Putative cysteine ligase BshC n=2 Tax=Aquibacillus albus TaxID=1168171 RepID=A0ABS2N1D6_9BACI|nr:bacillithiol biosynthesis cysteine-adding enzyme BshC [Aquibacillus albus]